MEKEISILDKNYDSLRNHLDLTDLLGRLFSAKVINKRQMDFISSKPTYDRNHAFLGILRRRSLRDYNQAIRCLRETKQDHIADILECGESSGVDRNRKTGWTYKVDLVDGSQAAGYEGSALVLGLGKSPRS